jgi:hypothetical protein
MYCRSNNSSWNHAAPQRWPQPGRQAVNVKKQIDASAEVEPIPVAQKSSVVSDELLKLTDILHSVCPSDAVIAFEFAGALHVHIDVRSLEDMTRLETLMPSLGGGVFYDIQRGLAARRSFFHRLSASVAR